MHQQLKSDWSPDGEPVFILPADLYQRWERQIATKYVDLPAEEKASDMEQVDRYWPLIQKYIAQHDQQRDKQLLERLVEAMPEKREGCTRAPHPLGDYSCHWTNCGEATAFNEAIDQCSAAVEEILG